MRIDIVGLPGSGKSTLAKAIASKLAIPHIQLDRFWFESGGRKNASATPNIEEVRAKIRERIRVAVQADAWVSDGVYLRSQDLIAWQADVVIFLDVPLWRRLLNHAHRAFFEPKRHTELAFRDELTFFVELVKRDFKSKPKLLRFVAEHFDKVVTRHSRKEIQSYLNAIRTKSPH